LIGTPPNLVLAGVVEETFGYEITFAQWFKFGFPISMYYYLYAGNILQVLLLSLNKKNFLVEERRLANN